MGDVRTRGANAINALENRLKAWIWARASRLRVGAHAGDDFYIQTGSVLLVTLLATLVAAISWLDGRLPSIGWASAMLVASSAWHAVLVAGNRAIAARVPSGVMAVICVASALAFSASVGILAGVSLLQPIAPETRMLTCGFAVIYASSIAARHSATPLMTLAKVCLAFLPMFAIALVSGNSRLIVTAIVLLPLIAVFAVVTLTAFAALNLRLTEVAEVAGEAQALREAALRDGVTGLHNREGLERQAQMMLGSLAEGRRLAFVWINLRHFRQTNDALSHATGDRMLRETAERIGRCIPNAACLARYSGDEFVLLAEIASRAEADALVARVSLELSRPLRISGHRIESGAAIGAALYPDDADDLEALEDRADMALYHARIAGRHQVRFFDPAMARGKTLEKDLEADLRSAMQRDELAVYFQPIIDLSTGRIRSFEALVRWFHPVRGEVPPARFIPVAEDTGMIITLGNWIAARAARAAASWPEHVGLSINLAPAQVRAPGAALGVMQALRDAGLDPRRLQIEVTESLFVEEDAGHAALFFDELAAEGVRFVLDDFGTGQSSLSYIGKYPFCAIKVDEGLVSGPMTGPGSDAIIRAVAEMGSSLGMDTVAEGLETLQQVKAARAAGCTHGQGFYYSRPVPDHMAANLLAEEDGPIRLDRAAG